jgi:predicted nuclease of predicted toxin-antitoxin system
VRRFLVDASSDARHVPQLRSFGHDVTRVGTEYPASMKDRDILALAHREQRILITDDRDFGELVFRLRQPHAGVIYLRLDTTRFEVRARRIEEVLARHADDLDQFLVVTTDSVRVRRSQGA